MRDFLQDCMEDFRRKAQLNSPVAPGEFRELFCSKCNNLDCVNHHSGDPLSERVAKQFERLVHAEQADPLLPQYAQIVAKEWADMTREALKLEISDRKGDWEVPDVPDIDITDGVAHSAGRGRTEVVDEAVRNLARAQGKEAPNLPEIKDDPDEYARDAADLLGDIEEEPEPEPPKKPAPQHPKANPTFRPAARGNAEAQDGMIDGGAIPEPEEPDDPWAVTPETGGKKVEAGATITFGDGGEIK